VESVIAPATAAVSSEDFIVFMICSPGTFFIFIREIRNNPDKSIQQQESGNGLPQMHRNVRTGRIRPGLAVD
ncbi:hypothetical protein, partial [Pontibacterium sp.]|uniref:hypothetical protein n=1 Tax=Pontibacterium sp. TaxID=2036026 RepID=UPI0035183148